MEANRSKDLVMDRRTFLSVSLASTVAAGVALTGLDGLADDDLITVDDDNSLGLVEQLHALMASLPATTFPLSGLQELASSQLLSAVVHIGGRQLALADLLVQIPAEAFPLAEAHALVTRLAIVVLRLLVSEGLATEEQGMLSYNGAASVSLSIPR